MKTGCTIPFCIFILNFAFCIWTHRDESSHISILMSVSTQTTELPPAVRACSRRRATANPRVRVGGRAGLAGRRAGCGVLDGAALAIGCSSRRRPCGGWRLVAVCWPAVCLLPLSAPPRVRADFRCQRRPAPGAAFPQLGDHVLTAVDVAHSPGARGRLSPGAGRPNATAAASAIGRCSRGRIVQSRAAGAGDCRRPPRRAFRSACSPCFRSDTFGFWLERIALSDEPWPRRVQLEVVGFPPDARRRARPQAGAGRRLRAVGPRPHGRLTRCRTSGNPLPLGRRPPRARHADPRRRGRAAAATSSNSSATNSSTWPATWSSTSWAATTASATCSCKSSIGPSCTRSSWNASIPNIWSAKPRRLPVTGGMRIPEGTRLVLHASSTKPLAPRESTRRKDQQDTALGVCRSADKRAALGIRHALGRRRAAGERDRRGRRRLARAVSRVARRRAGRSAASGRAARGHRHGDHARRRCRSSAKSPTTTAWTTCGSNIKWRASRPFAVRSPNSRPGN